MDASTEQPELQPPLASGTTRGAGPPAMGRTVTGGMAWMLLNTIVGRGGSFVAQIVLGWLLSQGDFGLYAIAISVAGFVQVFREGGLRQLLIRRGNEFGDLQGPVFWITLAFNVAAAAFLAAGAPLAAQFYDAPALAPLLWVIAASMPLGAPAIISQAKLTIDLRFRPLSRIMMVSSCLRYGLMIAFALLGMGPLSFVFPLLFVAAYESVAGAIETRTLSWHASPQVRSWGGLLAQAKWVIAGSLASLLVVSGDYLVLGWMEDEKLIGVYFFAFQLSVQLHMMLLGNLQAVLLPSLSRLEDDPPRMASAFTRAMDSMAVIIFPATFVLGLVAAPLEAVIWRGRWVEAVPVVQILCLTLPLRSITSLTKSLLDARGRFATYFVTAGMDGIANMAAAAIGAWIGGLFSISVAIAIYMAVSGIAQAFLAAAQLSVSPTAVLQGQIRPAVAALIAGGGAWLAQHLFLSHTFPVLNLLTTSALFALAYLVMALVLFPHQVDRLRELVVSLIKPAGGMKREVRAVNQGDQNGGGEQDPA